MLKFLSDPGNATPVVAADLPGEGHRGTSWPGKLKH